MKLGKGVFNTRAVLHGSPAGYFLLQVRFDWIVRFSVFRNDLMSFPQASGVHDDSASSEVRVKEFTRRTIAAALGAAVGGKSVVSVYDYARKRAFSYNAEMIEGLLNGYDHDRGHYVSGSMENNAINLYDSGLNKRITIFITGDDFSGYDYHTQTYFTGAVDGDSISMVDHENGGHYRFLV